MRPVLLLYTLEPEYFENEFEHFLQLTAVYPCCDLRTAYIVKICPTHL